MSGTSVSPTACYVDAFGIHAPAFADIMTYLQGQMRLIYGNDIYLGNDSPDGQFIGIMATAVNDTNSATIAVFNSYSPNGAQGVGLSSQVKINNIKRLLASTSSFDIDIGGQVGSDIINGYIIDANDVIWNFPPLVTIPLSGSITATATSVQLGAIVAQAPYRIGNPQFGWQTLSNPTSTTLGAPVEQDGALRTRQALSTALPSQSRLDAIAGAIANLPGVVRVAPYENDTGSPDTNNMPAHSISFVVEGGNVSSIAATIANMKTAGAATYGATSVVVVDAYGVPHTINFFVLTSVPVAVNIHIKPLNGYTSTIGGVVVAAVGAYIQSLKIGQAVLLSKVYTPANLTSATGGDTFDITSIVMSRDGGLFNAADVPISFNEGAVAGIISILVGA